MSPFIDIIIALFTIYFIACLTIVHPFFPPFIISPRFIPLLIVQFILPLLPLLPYLSSITPFLFSYIFFCTLAIRRALPSQHAPHPRSFLRLDIALYLLLPPITLIQHHAPAMLVFFSSLCPLFAAVQVILRRRYYIPTQSTSPSHPSVAAPTKPPTVFNASAITLLSFDWATSTVVLGKRRPLEATDIHPLADSFRAQTVLRDRFLPHWRAQQRTASPSLLRALFAAVGARFMIGGLLKLLSDALLLTNPVILRSIITYLQHRQQYLHSPMRGVLLSAVLFFCCSAQMLVFHQYFNVMCTVQSLVQASLLTTVFEKSCRLSPYSRARYTVGQIQNLMANDSRRVADIVLYLHMLWSSCEQIAVAMLLLTGLLGSAPTIAGVLFICASCVFQSRIVSVMKHYREQASACTDERIKFVGEAIKGIKLVKLYAWETSFVKRILGARADELLSLRKIAILRAWNFMLISSIPTLLTILAFSIYALTGHALDAAVVFPAIALFNVIRPSIMFLPNNLVEAAAAAASLSRLRGFLTAEELTPLGESAHAVDQDSLQAHQIDISAKNAAFSWNPYQSPSRPTLFNVNISIPEGKFVAIVGPTGGGKSTLLAGLLGEVSIVSGQAGVRENRSISFCDQVPFIQNATVRDNILFGKPYNQNHYCTTIRVCNLVSDLKLLPAADLTEIGGRGVNLSGGQRARVALARSVYSRSDIYLFDDPLSAVDAFVGKSIFRDCIAGMLHGRTRMLTTNQIHYALSPEVDIVIVVRNGEVVEAGPKEDLLSIDSEFSRMAFAAGELGRPSIIPDTDERERDALQQKRQRSIETEELEIKTLISSSEQKMRARKQINTVASEEVTNYGAIESGMLTKKETKEVGHVRVKHYKTYFSSMGMRFWVPCILVCSLASHVASLSVNIWLSMWSDQPDTVHVFRLLLVFFILGLVTVLAAGIASFALAFGSIRASVLLHEKMLISVFGAPISFFNSTPDGRLVNRFNSDLDKIDSTLSPTLQSLLRLVFNLNFTLCLILWATPTFVLVFIPVAALCVYIQEYYRKTSVDLRRLEALAKSPLYSHFSETLDGVVTIRAFGDVPRATIANNRYTDMLIKISYASTYANRWVAVRLESLGALLIFCATLLAVTATPSQVSASTVGLVLSYTIQIITTMTWVVRQFTETESQLSAVERVAEYSEPPFPQEEKGGIMQFKRKTDLNSRQFAKNLSIGLISQETLNGLDQSGAKPKPRWPRKGLLQFEKVEMKYRKDLDPALRDLTLTVQPGEHVGIVGRTGAGKSSAIQCLFRLYEPKSGRILIDGVDISNMRLFDLRSSLGIIPQEPVCFSGTIRSNLDMFGEHKEDELKRALELCGLQETIGVEATLDFEVAENGSNLSVGQRQLLCLGRALLKDSNVLVLDEATSSVSNATDEKIQTTLKNEMWHCTILTVAHRLQTVMNSDKIVVMDKGRVVEIGNPSELLRRRSWFSDLVDETGTTSAARLRDMALSHETSQSNWNNRHRHIIASEIENGIVTNDYMEASDDMKYSSSLRENFIEAFSELQSALQKWKTNKWKDNGKESNINGTERCEHQICEPISRLRTLVESLRLEKTEMFDGNNEGFCIDLASHSMSRTADYIEEE